MKFLVFAFLLIHFNAHANTLKAIVIDYKCVEIDPFTVGDVCLLNVIKDNGHKLSLVFNHEAATNPPLIVEEMTNLNILINELKLSYIYDSTSLSKLRSYNNEYFYMFAGPDAVKVDTELSSELEMKRLVNQTRHFSPNALPAGYKARKTRTPKLDRNFTNWLKHQTNSVLEDWKTYVYGSDEFYNNTEQTIAQIAQDPRKYLNVPYILEISQTYKIFKNSIHIGHVFETTNWVESAIIQDGAWFDVYTTTEQKVIHAEEETN